MSHLKNNNMPKWERFETTESKLLKKALKDVKDALCSCNYWWEDIDKLWKKSIWKKYGLKEDEEDTLNNNCYTKDFSDYYKPRKDKRVRPLRWDDLDIFLGFCILPRKIGDEDPIWLEKYKKRMEYLEIKINDIKNKRSKQITALMPVVMATPAMPLKF